MTNPSFLALLQAKGLVQPADPSQPDIRTPSGFRVCMELHAGKTRQGEWDPGSASKLITWSTSRSLIFYKFLCSGCGFTTGPLPHAYVEKLLSEGWRIAADLSYEEKWGPSPERVCSYAECERIAVDDHHFAPQNTFDDADSWPVLPLCRHHHEMWHSKMDGYRRHRRGQR
jgi:hypothetical protein